MKLFFIALLVTALIVLIYKLVKKKGEETASKISPPLDLANLTITDAIVGDAISILGIGAEFDNIDFTIDRRNRYQSGADSWYEVSGTYQGSRVFLECYDDDEVEVNFVYQSPEPTLVELGVTEDDLVRMDDEQIRSNGIDYDGSRWTYKESGEIDFFKNSRGEGEGYYSWSFVSQDKERILSIEKWEGKPFETSIARSLDPEIVKIYRA